MLILFLKALAMLHVAGLVACVSMLNLDRFESIKRNLAIGMLVLFASGTGLIFLLEELQPFIWETAAPTRACRQLSQMSTQTSSTPARNVSASLS